VSKRLIAVNLKRKQQKKQILSGSQYKKKRLKKETQGSKLSHVIKQFVVQKSGLD
jgi:hypothetical protein